MSNNFSKTRLAMRCFVGAVLIACSFQLFLSSCSSIDCPIENVVAVKYFIYDSDDTEQELTDTLSVISKRKDGTDTLILNSLIDATFFTLPISYSHPEDVLVFKFTNTQKKTLVDTVWIKKNDIPHFESVDCSASFFHELTGVRYTTNAIDSLVLKNSSVTYDASVIHFNLYPKVSH